MKLWTKCLIGLALAALVLMGQRKIVSNAEFTGTVTGSGASVAAGVPFFPNGVARSAQIAMTANSARCTEVIVPFNKTFTSAAFFTDAVSPALALGIAFYNTATGAKIAEATNGTASGYSPRVTFSSTTISGAVTVCLVGSAAPAGFAIQGAFDGYSNEAFVLAANRPWWGLATEPTLSGTWSWPTTLPAKNNTSIANDRVVPILEIR